MSHRAVGVALAGIALTLIALMFGTAPLFVPGIAFALIGIAAPVAAWLGARGASIERRLSARRVTEDEQLEATIRVSGRWLRALANEVREPLVPAAIPLGAGRTIRIALCFDRRGRHAIEQPALVVRDPLALARHVVTSAGPASELLVLPRTSEVRSITQPGGGEGSDALGVPSQALAAVDLDGLRPYRPGTSAARIHWPALARGAGLLERRLRAETDTRPLIVLDARGAEPAEQLDAAVRAAASLALVLGRGGCGLLLPGDRRPTAVGPDLSAWTAAHARLALVHGGPGAPAPALGAARARLGPIFYVAARALDRLPPAADRIARGSGVLILPAALPAPVGGTGRPTRASFEVAGCVGYEVRARGPHGARTSVGAGVASPGGAR